jgi:AraC family transcriptional regulator
MPVTLLSETIVRDADIREIVYDGDAIPRHAHAKAGFCLVLGGTYEERYAGRTLACRPRTVTFSPAGEEHANVFSAPRAHCLTADLPASWLERLEGSAARLRDPFETQGGTLAWLGGRLLAETRERAGASPLVIEGLILEMLGESARRSGDSRGPQASPAIRRTRDLVDARFREALTLADLAEAAGRHPVYVATAFRQAYGETVGDCVRRLRIEYAARELARSDIALAELALAAGFANQSNLTRAFKRVTGMTPGEYRRRTANP